MTEELSLLMGPVGYVAGSTHRDKMQFGWWVRWVRENGHPGHCGEDCWHLSAEAALDCFGGRQ